jgi:hypothetical protein
MPVKYRTAGCFPDSFGFVTMTRRREPSAIEIDEYKTPASGEVSNGRGFTSIRTSCALPPRSSEIVTTSPAWRCLA